MTKLQELLKQINRKHVYIQTHNFPDPDAIASALGIQELLKHNGISSTAQIIGIDPYTVCQSRGDSSIHRDIIFKEILCNDRRTCSHFRPDVFKPVWKLFIFRMMIDADDLVPRNVIHMLENSNLCFDDLMAYSSAISSIEVYDDISFCNTGKDCPVIANISDFMLALKEVTFSVVYSRKSDGIKLSVRSEKSMLDAGKIVAEALKGIGNGGGHASMAGGFVPCTGSDMDVKLLEAQMKERFLNVIADVKKRAL